MPPSRPRVLVTCDRRDGEPSDSAWVSGAPRADAPAPDAASGRVRPRRAEVHVQESLVMHLRAAGALPLLVPPDEAPDVEALLAVADAVVLTGGAHDLHPRHYGQAIVARIGRVDEARAGLELPLARACLARDLPVLGICGGMQAMVVATGGTLVQDLATQRPGALEHEQVEDPATPGHAVRAWGPLGGLVGEAVNSTHHQAVDLPGAFEVCAVAPDGVIEGVYAPGHRFALGVQWHPELLDGRLFEALARAAR